MSADPGGDLRAHIETAAIGFTGGTNLFDGAEQPAGAGVPDEALFVLPYGGPAPMADVGGSTEERFPKVQLLYRSDPDEYNDGETAARLVLETVHHQTIARGVGGSYTDCTADTSAPLYLGMDEKRRHRWTINVELWHRE